ncbi:MAG: hypothetical protein MJD61_14870 [Proteobacteria bacterium]|nr:hypothetical protein [Pseudomonadota bacterium]
MGVSTGPSDFDTLGAPQKQNSCDKAKEELRKKHEINVVPLLNQLIRDPDPRSALRQVIETKKEVPELAHCLGMILQWDAKKIAAVHDLLIQLGDRRTVRQLRKALNKYGDGVMAQNFLNSGHWDLRSAAHHWAADHGYDVHPFPASGTAVPRWGGN